MIGGNSGINKRVDVLETEVYNPDFDQWTVVKPISMGQSEAGACVVSNNLFLCFILGIKLKINVLQIEYLK